MTAYVHTSFRLHDRSYMEQAHAHAMYCRGGYPQAHASAGGGRGGGGGGGGGGSPNGRGENAFSAYQSALQVLAHCWRSHLPFRSP